MNIKFMNHTVQAINSDKISSPGAGGAQVFRWGGQHHWNWFWPSSPADASRMHAWFTFDGDNPTPSIYIEATEPSPCGIDLAGLRNPGPLIGHDTG